MLLPYMFKDKIEAGCDEAGRGSLVGPVTAAAVILPKNWECPLLDDSKKLSCKNRNLLREIIEKEAIDFAVHFIDHKEIDRINILQASIIAMHRAVDHLKIHPEHLLIDGNRFVPYPNPKVTHTCVVKGDSKYASIAAASILAKTYRDEYMIKLHEEFPQYSWATNKGYPTKKHRASILEYGVSKYQRTTFKIKPI